MRTPIFTRPCNISSLALGIDLISHPYRVVSNLGGKERDLLASEMDYLDVSLVDHERSTFEIISAATDHINALMKDSDVWIAPYQSGHQLWDLCCKNGWNRAFVNPDLANLLENKIELNHLFAEEAFLIRSEGYDLPSCDWETLSKQWGDHFVLQIVRDSDRPISGGKGTFFIENQEDFQRALKLFKSEDMAKVAQYIDGYSLNVNACIIGSQILMTDFSSQIIGPKECSKNPASYNGNDWTFAKQFDSDLRTRIFEMIRKVGEKLVSMGYQGIYGIDILVDKQDKNPYLLEINPRQQGSTGILTHFHHRLGLPSLVEYHTLAFLEEEVSKHNLERDKKLLLAPLEGAQLILRSLEDGPVQVMQSPASGVYLWINGELKWQRPGWNPKQLNDGELLVYAIAPEGYKLQPQERLANVVSLTGILEGDSYHLNDQFSALVQELYSQFIFKPILVS